MVVAPGRSGVAKGNSGVPSLNLRSGLPAGGFTGAAVRLVGGSTPDTVGELAFGGVCLQYGSSPLPGVQNVGTNRI